MLTVVCVYRSGGVYTEQDVISLREQVTSNLTVNHEFVCLSDTDVGAGTIALQHNWPGWWSKMELYGPLLHDKEDILYIDLDTVIAGNIDWVIDQVANIVMLRDFNIKALPASGLMFWRGGVMRSLYDKFSVNPEAFIERYRGIGVSKGDQGFFQNNRPDVPINYWQDMFPGRVVSYKKHCTEFVPFDAKIICFHGRTKPKDVPDLLISR